MACYLYKKKDGVITKEEVFAHDVGHLLSHGFKSTPEGFDEDDEVSNEDIREAAKEAGIDGWKTAQIKTLKGKLEDVHKD